MDADRQQRLTDFVAWADAHITGDEKGQAQVFLDHLFRAFGQPGVLDVGATYEERIKRTQGGTAFADLVWKPHVLIEMKKRGTDLATAYQQAFEYWTRLVPGRPHYVVLCNFDEFWVYDFDIQVDEPVDQVALADLPQRYGPLAFLFPTEETPTFGNNNEQVTREAAAHLGKLFNKLGARQDVGRATAQRFVLQLLVALFSEDIGLLPQYTVEGIVRDADSPAKAYDLFLDLFRAMNEPTPRTGGRFKGIQYFNGGLYADPVSVELAKVTMMIARKLAIDELHMDEQALPLDNLDDNFRACDALIVPADSPWAPPQLADAPQVDGRVPTMWPAADVIIGNPPFLGAKRLKPERGGDYVDAVRKLYPDVPGMADYCVYWFRRAHDHLPTCTPDDPLRGRAGLVGTQNIRNNKSREGGLDHIVAEGGVIIDAVDNQPWSGEANVHVSIANWVKTDGQTDPADLLIPDKKRLWFKVEEKGKKTNRKRGEGPATKQYELSCREADHINAALSDQVSVSEAKSLVCNKEPQRCFQGVVLGYDGFAVSHARRKELIAADPRNGEVVRPWLIGRDLLTGDGIPSRCVIDFGSRDMLEARAYALPFQIVERDVLPAVRDKAALASGAMKKARAEHLERWWQFWNVRTSMRETFGTMNRYLAMSRTTKRPVLAFVSVAICPDSKIQAFACDDDYSFAVLSSFTHWFWFESKSARLKNQEDLAYSSRSVFDTFPWPQGPDYGGPSDAQVDAVAEAGRVVRQVRDEALTKIKGGLRALYRTLELPGKNPLKDAHTALDDAVLQAYGFDAKADLLQQLLDLNLAVAEREKRGEPVIAPGIPPHYAGDRDALITDDCIRL